MVRRAAALLALLTISGCAAHMFTPPAGPGVPVPDAAAAWDEATRPCRSVRNTRANLRVAVRAGRLRSPSDEVLAIATATGNLRLEDRSVFAMAGTASSTRLWLRQQNEVATAPAADLIDALIGVRLSPQRLLAVMTGCVTMAPAMTEAVGFGKQIRVRTADSSVFIERRDGRWRAVAADVDGLIIDYRAYNNYWPAEWRAARAAGGDALILDVVIEDAAYDQAAVDTDPKMFQLEDPPGATAITLDELRAMGLFARRK